MVQDQRGKFRKYYYVLVAFCVRLGCCEVQLEVPFVHYVGFSDIRLEVCLERGQEGKGTGFTLVGLWDMVLL